MEIALRNCSLQVNPVGLFFPLFFLFDGFGDRTALIYVPERSPNKATITCDRSLLPPQLWNFFIVTS